MKDIKGEIYSLVNDNELLSIRAVLEEAMGVAQGALAIMSDSDLNQRENQLAVEQCIHGINRLIHISHKYCDDCADTLLKLATAIDTGG